MNRATLLLCCALVCLCVQARTARDFFVKAPADVIRLLTESQRLDMLDYYDVGNMDPMENRMFGQSQLLVVTDDYLALRSSDPRTVTFRLLTSGRDTVIAVVETVAIPVPDSRIVLYDKSWKPLPVKRHPVVPAIADFVRKGTPQSVVELLQQSVPFDVVELRWEGENHDRLVAHHSLREFLTADVWKRLAPHMLDTIELRVQGTKIKRDR